MRTCTIFILTLLCIAAHSQNTLNNYKYVLVPSRFNFSKSDDQYQLNSTTKSMLEQKGFVALWANGDMPPAVAANKCSALFAEVDQRKAMFTTNLTLLLKDCSGNIIFKSKEGRSREKEFFVAYDEALKDALSSLNTVSYKYDSVPAATPPATPPAAPPVAAPVATNPPPVPTQSKGTLYAQPIPNGYQLIDTSPKKVLTLLKTSIPDYFIAQNESSTGLVFKKEGEWFFEYYKDDKLVSQKLDIKF